MNTFFTIVCVQNLLASMNIKQLKSTSFSLKTQCKNKCPCSSAGRAIDL